MNAGSRTRRVTLWVVTALFVLAIPLDGYVRHAIRESRAAQHPRSPRSGDSTQPTLTPPGTFTPGIRHLGFGRVQASGTVRYVDLEGGFWALVDPTTDPGSSQTEEVVIVVVNAEEIGLPALEGQDLLLNGKLLEGASIRMAGPEMTAEEIVRPH